MAIKPLVTLEIGTSKVVALVGEMRDEGNVIITGMGEQPSVGIRKGEIVDAESVYSCLSAVINAAEENGRTEIHTVLLAVSGGHIQSTINRGTIPVHGKDRVITRADIEQITQVSRAVNLPDDRTALHTILQLFCVDDQERVVQPEGMQGVRLSLDMLILHGVRNRFHSRIGLVQKLGLDVQDTVFSGLCSALSVLTAEQRKGGALMIDLGAGTTDYLVYADNVVAAAGALGVGGEHVTNDIALAFSIAGAQAERLKREFGSAIVVPEDAERRTVVPEDVGFSGKSVGIKSLQTVMHARMEEIFLLVRRNLEQAGVLSHHLGAGVVLTGGGSQMKGVTELASRVFDAPCSVGVPRSIDGLATATQSPAYATACGLMLYGFKTRHGSRGGFSIGRWAKGLLGR